MTLQDVITKVRDTVTTNKEWLAEKQGVLMQLQEAETKIKDYAESAVTATQMKSDFETKIADLKKASETQVADMKASHGKEIEEIKKTADTQAAELNAEIEKLKTELSAKAEEIKKVETSVDAKANEKTQKALASMNLNPNTLPAGDGKDTAVTDVLALLANASPSQRSEIFKNNKEAVLKAANVSNEQWQHKQV